MATEIRGTTDDSTRMLLGQIRKVFDPQWIQAFDNGRFTVQFKEVPETLDALIRFAEMYGYTVYRTDEDAVWPEYVFE